MQLSAVFLKKKKKPPCIDFSLSIPHLTLSLSKSETKSPTGDRKRKKDCKRELNASICLVLYSWYFPSSNLFLFHESLMKSTQSNFIPNLSPSFSAPPLTHIRSHGFTTVIKRDHKSTVIVLHSWQNFGQRSCFLLSARAPVLFSFKMINETDKHFSVCDSVHFVKSQQ